MKNNNILQALMVTHVMYLNISNHGDNHSTAVEMYHRAAISNGQRARRIHKLYSIWFLMNLEALLHFIATTLRFRKMGWWPGNGGTCL